MLTRPPTPPVDAPILTGGRVNERMTQVWLDYFMKWQDWGSAGWSGTFTNGDGDTVTVENGLITGVS